MIPGQNSLDMGLDHALTSRADLSAKRPNPSPIWSICESPPIISPFQSGLLKSQERMCSSHGLLFC
jgi:hypothetical protein